MLDSTLPLFNLRKCLRWSLAAITTVISFSQPATAQSGRFTPKIAAGYSHSVTLQANGLIATHGENRSGEIGNGTTTTRLSPYFISPPAGKTWAQVATGDFRTTALTSDGLMYSWGSNGYSQLGDGTTNAYLTPNLIVAPAGKQWASVSAGYGHTLALCTDGTLYTWGTNYNGQLGTGIASTLGRLQIPVPTSGQTWNQVAAGYNFSLALCSDGSLYAWGNNDQGQLGDGTIQPRSTPVRVAPPSGQRWTRISAGFWNSAALCSDGLLYMWGANYGGQIGDGTTTGRLVPVSIAPPAGTSWQQVSIGYQHTIAVCSNGSLYVWGDNYYGELGNGTNTSRTTPSPVLPPTGLSWTQAACGSFHSLALASNGQMYSTGYNFSGELGSGTTVGSNHFLPIGSPLSTSSSTGVNATALSLALHPNPFKELLHVEITVPNTCNASATLYTTLGQPVQNQVISLRPGKNKATINGLSGLAAGIYFLAVTTDHTRQIIQVVHE